MVEGVFGGGSASRRTWRSDAAAAARRVSETGSGEERGHLVRLRLRCNVRVFINHINEEQGLTVVHKERPLAGLYCTSNSQLDRHTRAVPVLASVLPPVSASSLVATSRGLSAESALPPPIDSALFSPVPFASAFSAGTSISQPIFKTVSVTFRSSGGSGTGTAGARFSTSPTESSSLVFHDDAAPLSATGPARG
jgi:hypothetical protein